jgi:hypothetical protein
VIDWDTIDDAFSTPTPLAEPLRATAVVANGIYILVFPCGTRKTFRIFTKKQTAKFAPGKRVVALLIGPDNSDDWELFGFVDDTGIHVWKRFQHQRQAEYARLLWMLATGCEADGHELLISKRCLRCNRRLTQPHAIEAGIGDECRRKIDV